MIVHKLSNEEKKILKLCILIGLFKTHDYEFQCIDHMIIITSITEILSVLISDHTIPSMSPLPRLLPTLHAEDPVLSAHCLCVAPH